MAKFRELLLRNQIKKDYIPKEEAEQLKKARAQDLIDTLQKDLGIDFLLDYSELVKKLKGKSVEEVLNKLEQKEQETKEKQKLLDKTIALLGEKDVKTLTDLSNLLQGQSLKELVDNKTILQQKIKDQDTALLNLARQKIKGKKEAEQLLNDLETK